MNIEDYLIPSFLIGTQEELQKYGKREFPQNVKLAACYFVEFGALVASPIGSYAFWTLTADVGVRWVRGMLNMAKNYQSSRKNASTMGLEMLADITEQPGIIGDMRETASWLVKSIGF